MTVHINWRDHAACRDADPDLFFPVGTTGPALRDLSEAKRICLACPVQAQCLAWALNHGVTDGVWGGTTSDERRTSQCVQASHHQVQRSLLARSLRTGQSHCAVADTSTIRPHDNHR